MTFATKDEAINIFVKSYSNSTRSALIIASDSKTTKSQLVYQCKHGKKRHSESKGKRCFQKTVKKDCPLNLRFYVRKTGETVLTKANLTHDHHAINEKVFKQDSAKADDLAREIIKQMLEGNCNVFTMKQALRAQGIHLTSDQIHYQIKQIVGAPEDEQKLAKLLQVVKDEGGNVNIQHSPDGKIRVLTVSTVKMRKAYSGTKSTVIQLDNTFGIKSFNYKLNALLYHNLTTGLGEVAQFLFMADETADSFTHLLETFKDVGRSIPKVILIDKVRITILLLLLLPFPPPNSASPFL